MINTIDIAWAAGFIEGEGCFYCGKTPSNHGRVSVSATQKEIEPLLRLKRIFGGSIHTRPTGISVWQVASRLAAQTMMTIYILMSERRKKKIVECLDLWKTMRGRRSNGSRICTSGHDTTKYGLTSDGRCVLCRKLTYYRRGRA
jgi:hypothetical protein